MFDANSDASIDGTLCNLTSSATAVGLCAGNWDYRGAATHMAGDDRREKEHVS
jgi:hypothetical protein